MSLWAKTKCIVDPSLVGENVKSPLSDQSSYLDNVAKCRSILLSLSTQENSVSLVRHHLNQFFSNRYAAYAEQQRTSNTGFHSETTQPPTLPEIAQELAVSARTLARRLEARGSSYKSLLKSQRNELAVRVAQHNSSKCV